MMRSLKKIYADRAWRTSQGIALAIALTLAAVIFLLTSMERHGRETAQMREYAPATEPAAN